MSKTPKNMGGGKGGPMVGQKPKNFRKTIKKLFFYLKSYWFAIVSGLFFAGASTVLSIIGPNEIQKIGKLLLTPNFEMSAVVKIGIGLLIIYVCSFIFSFLQSYIMSGVTARISKDFRNKLSNKINDLPLKYLDTTAYGDVLSRVLT